MNDQERLLLQQIGRTSRSMNTAFEARVGQALPRWRILQTLRDQGCTSQKQLAAQLQMDPGALTRQMKALESERLVTRQSDPQDNRLTMVTLSDAGTALIDATQAERKAFVSQAVKGLPKAQVSQAMALLKTLEERFKAMAQG